MVSIGQVEMTKRRRGSGYGGKIILLLTYHGTILNQTMDAAKTTLLREYRLENGMTSHATRNYGLSVKLTCINCISIQIINYDMEHKL